MALSDIDRRRDDAVPVLRRWDGGEIVCQAAGESLKIWDVRSNRVKARSRVYTVAVM